MNDTAKISARGDRLFEGDEVIAEFVGWQAEQNAEKAATALRASAGGEPAVVTGIASAPADIVRFASEGRTVLVIRHDGRVDVAEGVEPGEAGRLAMAAMGEALARELAAAREEEREACAQIAYEADEFQIAWTIRARAKAAARDRRVVFEAAGPSVEICDADKVSLVGGDAEMPPPVKLADLLAPVTREQLIAAGVHPIKASMLAALHASALNITTAAMADAHEVRR